MTALHNFVTSFNRVSPSKFGGDSINPVISGMRTGGGLTGDPEFKKFSEKVGVTHG